MKDSPNYFKMNPGSKEVDSPGTFKNTSSVLNMGSPVNYGTEGGDDKKQAKSKAPKLSVQTEQGPKAPRGPQSGSILGVPVSIQTKGRSTKNTDLLQEAKKAYKKVRSYFD